jgi:WRKY transcription factor 33
VERACHDTRAVVTTYEGKHNHDVPPARGSASLYRAALAAHQMPQQAGGYQQGGGLIRTADGFGFGAGGHGAPMQAAESGFALSGFGDAAGTAAYSYTSHHQHQQQTTNEAMYYAKDEPRDDMSFFEQPLLF